MREAYVHYGERTDRKDNKEIGVLCENERGFVALISILIISAVLLVAVTSLAEYGMIARYSLLDLERKTQSESYAMGCVSIARIAIVNDNDFDVTDKEVSIDDHTCIIEDVATVSGNKRVKVSAVVEGATTNYQVDIAPSTGDIERFIELTS